MGRYTLIDDYLIDPKNANYVELVKVIKCFHNDDDRLLVPALFHLGRDGRMRMRYSSTLKPRATVKMMEVTPLLMKLRGHSYNIFESCFLLLHGIGLYIADASWPLFWATFSLIAQFLLLVILMYYNISNTTNVITTNGLTIVVIVITTVFFIKLAFPQWRGAYNFSALFWKAGFSEITRQFKFEWLLRKAMLIINILVNGVLGVAVVAFNIYFQLIAENVNDAILNGLSLSFILKIDDTLKPDWDEKHFDRYLAVNVHHYITCGCVGGWDRGGVQVDIISKSTDEDYLHLLERSDGKAHFILTEDNHQLAAAVFWSRRDGMNEQEKYRIVQFCISGENGQDLFNNIKKFHCVQNDKLEYHELGKLLLEALNRDDSKKDSAEVQGQPVRVVPDSRAVLVSTSRSGHGENSAISVDSIVSTSSSEVSF
jgi:hypothetical protein